MARSWRKEATPEPPTASREVLRQVRRIDLRARTLVDSRFSGEYHSVFKGQGIEFAEVREYLPGDDVRSIDWNVTARLGRPYVKRFVEERELTVLLVVDLSGSQRWGTRRRFKSEQVAEVAAMLAMSAMRNNDRVGLLLLTDRVEWFVPPRKGRRHVLRLVRDLLAFRPAGSGTDLAAGLAYATRLLRSRSVVFLFSDFELREGWSAFARFLPHAVARHDVVGVRLSDPGDFELPRAGLVALQDPETGERVVIDASAPRTRQRYAHLVNADAERTTRLFRRLGVDEIRLRTDAPSAPALLAFFRGRARRLRR